MISLACTKCSTLLNVDDGFAGGVCRCSACGTIQTVPRKGDAPAKNGAAGTVIYERASREAVSKELEALGEVVTSSGIASSGILNQTGWRTARKTASLGTWIGIPLLVVVLLLGAWFLFFQKSEATPENARRSSAETAQSNMPPARTIAGPRFASIALDRGGTIVYLLDRGDATRPFTAPLQAAVLNSLATLQQNRRFQIRYWSADGDSPAFPLTPGETSEYNRKKAAEWMSGIIGGQSTDAVASLDAALAVKPSEIVLITGKAWQMDDSFTNQAVVKLTGKNIRVHVVSLGTTSSEDPLSRLASKTGGIYLSLSSGELEQLSQ